MKKTKIQNAALVRMVGQRLRWARKESGVSLADLHLRHGYSPSTINRWELRSLPTLPHLLKLCEVYGVRPSTIIDPVENVS